MAAGPFGKGCWVGGYSFELCCVAWKEFPGSARGALYAGDPQCWVEGYTYDRCCPPTLGKPRDLFKCHGRGAIWERFRRDMMLGRILVETDYLEVLKRDIAECILGGVLALLTQVYVVAVRFPGSIAAETAYRQANEFLAILLWSPISFEEIMASGWPFGAILSTLQRVEWIKERAASVVSVTPERRDEDWRLLSTIHDCIVRSLRVPSDVVFRSVLRVGAWKGDAATLPWHIVPWRSETMVPSTGHIEGRSQEELSTQDVLVAALGVWALFYSLRAFDMPLASGAELGRMEGEASRLAWLGDRLLRPALLRGEPLSELVSASLQGPLPELWEVLQWQPVVFVDPLGITRDSVYSRRFAGGLLSPNVSWPRLAPLELHVLPKYDSVSNMVRTSMLPFCYETSFLFTVVALGLGWNCEKDHPGILEGAFCSLAPMGAASDHRSPRHNLRLWEAGANLGDCTLWAAALLGQAATFGSLDFVAFEPLPAVAGKARRSAQALLEALRGSAAPPDARVSVIVRELALSDRASVQSIGIPKTSQAEATFYECVKKYGTGSAPGCDFLTVQSETIDRLLYGVVGVPVDFEHHDTVHVVERNRVGSENVIDLLKVHVQGSELPLLSGAQRALHEGRICMVLLKLTSLAFAHMDSGLQGGTSIAREVVRLLGGFKVALVAPNGTTWRHLGSGRDTSELLGYYMELAQSKKLSAGHQFRDAEGRSLPEPWEKQLVGWHEGPLCRNSPAVAVARFLWGAGERHGSREV